MCSTHVALATTQVLRGSCCWHCFQSALPLLGIGKVHLGFLQDNAAHFIQEDVPRFYQATQKLFLLGAIQNDSQDFVGMNCVLAIPNNRVRLSLKRKIFRCSLIGR